MAPVAFLILVALRLLLTVTAAPIAVGNAISARSSAYWMANIQRQGTVAYGDSSFQIYRNVMDFGAKGDGVTDDTDAINAAVSSGNRCGQGCDSSTVTPALVYFPPGTYLVSSPIIQYYYTQFVGDAVTPPTLKASAAFSGIAVIDSDPYAAGGANWYTNQNNFYRQVRNFVIDLTAMPETSGAGIHWQVAQATSLQNIVFNMISGASSKQIGIFMDNGSANFLSDLVFNGGNYGAFFGNQQFTTRNLTFNNCNTAVFMNWNWLWNLKSITVNNCGVALDISNSPTNQTVGSAILQDSTITNTPVGVLTAFSSDSVPTTGGTLILDNVAFQNCAIAVQSNTGSTILAGNQVVASWAQGRQYIASTGDRIQKTLTAPSKPSGLLDSNGVFFERAKPQYETIPASSFVSIKTAGAKGDGVTDDTTAIQNALNNLADGQILYFDHGAYVVTSTITVSGTKNVKITGEIWPLIMASGSFFSDQKNPEPVFKIGNAGDVGTFEMSDMIFETLGPAPGAILMEFNVAGSSPGAAGLWDVHFRVGGSAGTQLQSNTCAKNPTDIAPANPDCIGAFLLLHITSSASAYIENSWLWVADHELDLAGHDQVNIFNGRGLLVESTKPTWLYGTSVEHSVLYNYGIHNAENVYLGAIQTETPYFQSNPDATTPFTWNPTYDDPTFAFCTSGDESCKKSWGLKILNSQDIFVYGAGLYSFFDNYDQTCLNTDSCQENMVQIQGSNDVYLYGLSTKGVSNMVSLEGQPMVNQADNTNNFCSTIALWTEN